jgi:hypothetical protein
LWLRAAGEKDFATSLPMTRIAGNDYAVRLDAAQSAAGIYEYAVTTVTGERLTTFPGGESGQPGRWPFHGAGAWTYRVLVPGTALRLLNPAQDAAQLSFLRPGEQYRASFFRILPGEFGDQSVLRLQLPKLGPDTPKRYAASLYVGDRLATRTADLADADRLHVRLRAADGVNGKVLVKLIEKDGATWSTAAMASDQWSEVSVTLADLHADRSLLLPSPYPGLWNYWRPVPVGRGTLGDQLRVGAVERLELDIDAGGVDVESVWLSFSSRAAAPQ